MGVKSTETQSSLLEPQWGLHSPDSQYGLHNLANTKLLIHGSCLLIVFTVAWP